MQKDALAGHTAQRPSNPEAMRQLQEHYALCTMDGRHCKERPWTRDDALTLGRLYIAAYGTVPTPGRMRTQWCMPHARTICELFGSYAMYYTAIQETA